MNVVIKGTQGQMDALERYGTCVLAEGIQRTVTSGWRVDEKLYLEDDTRRAYVRVTGVQREGSETYVVVAAALSGTVLAATRRARVD